MASPFNRDFQREQKRQAILSEAARLFNVRGARGTTLAEVADRLELHKTSLYYYVDNKDDLIFRCYLASCSAIGELLDTAENEGGSGGAVLQAFIRMYFAGLGRILTGERPHLAMLTEIRALRPQHHRIISRHYRNLQARIRAIIRLGIADGSLRPADDAYAALALFGLLQLSVLWLPELSESDAGDAATRFTDILFGGLAAESWSLPEIASNSPGEPAVPGDPRTDETRQDAFTRVGSACFNRKGFAATSLEEIVAELRVTKGALYYRIRDKDDLLYRCFRRSLGLLDGVQQQAAERGGTGLAQLQFCAARLFAIQIGPAGPLIRFSLIPSLSRKYRRGVLAGIRRVSNRFGQMIDKGRSDGSIRDVDPFIAEQALVAAIDVSAEIRWMNPAGDLDAVGRSYYQTIFEGIGSDKTATPGPRS